MWVCLCRAVSTSTIRAAIAGGASTVKAVGEACGAGTDCTHCQRHIKLLLQQERAPIDSNPEESPCSATG